MDEGVPNLIESTEVVRSLAGNWDADPKWPLFVSYCTEGLYEPELNRLLNSLSKFELPFSCAVIKSRGRWFENVRPKPSFIYHQLKGTPRNVVWLDADSEVVSEPELLSRIPPEADVAGAIRFRKKHPGWILCNTLFFRNNARVIPLLFQWETLCGDPRAKKETPVVNKILERMTTDGLLTLHRIPRTYAQLHRKARWDGSPVILQWQACRRLKKKVNALARNEELKDEP